MTNQEQAAGAESQLLQAGRDIVIGGVSAADVVEITRREVARVVDELTLSAKEVAEERVEALGNKILERFAQAPEALGAFADPDFQFSLNDAGRAAASNDDQHTEDLLVDLLANRAEAGNTSRVRLATSHAIRAADKLSIETLNGLTATWAVTFLVPAHPDDLASSVQSIRRVADALHALGLPESIDWLQEAEPLNLARTYGGGLMTRKRYRDFIQSRVADHLVSGIPTQDFQDLVNRGDLPDLTGKVVPHSLKPDTVRLLGRDRDAFLDLFDPAITPSPPLEELISANGFQGRDDAAVEAWNSLIEEVPSVRRVEEWWDGLPYAELTLIGRVIGFVNARRHVQFEGAETIAQLLAAERSG